MASDDSPKMPTSDSQVPVVNEVNNEPKVGSVIGQCKWFSDVRGYGFITVQDGDLKGKDIFVHYSGIRPLNSIYKTLKKGEYVNFDVVESDRLYAVNVTGIRGGTLICDVNPRVKPVLPDTANVSQLAMEQVAIPPPPSPSYAGRSGGRGRGAGGRGSSTRQYLPRKEAAQTSD